MSSLFGTQNGKTILVVDIENGSVATALVRTSYSEPPKLFAEKRIHIPATSLVSSSSLGTNLIQSLSQALAATSGVAFELRQNKKQVFLGEIAQVELFFSSPWVFSTIENDVLGWSFEPEFEKVTRATVASMAGEAPIYSHPLGHAIAQSVDTLSLGRVLVSHITNEVLELYILDGEHILAQATIPLGFLSVLRRVQQQTGMSLHEIQSAIQLSYLVPEVSTILQNSLETLTQEVVTEFVLATQPLLEIYPADTIAVVGHEGAGQWFARSVLSHPNITSLFPQGGVLRVLKPKHVSSKVSVQADIPDLALMMTALHVDTHHHEDYSVV